MAEQDTKTTATPDAPTTTEGKSPVSQPAAAPPAAPATSTDAPAPAASTDAPAPKPAAAPETQPKTFSSAGLGQLLGGGNKSGEKTSLELIMDIEVPISVELGRTEMPIAEVLELGPGSIVELQKMASEPVDLLVNNKLVARGEVVVVDENFGIRITSVIDPHDRAKTIG